MLYKKADIEVLEKAPEQQPEPQGIKITRAVYEELSKNPKAFKDFRDRNKIWRIED